MNLKTAETYRNWKHIGDPFEENGKFYIEVEQKCGRCVRGVYAVGIENGNIKPHPAYHGVCLKCGGSGVLNKTVRLYTENELASQEKSKEKRKQKAEEQKIEREEQAHAKKLAKYGFNKDGITYVYFPSDSFEIKEQLKKDGFIFNPNTLWHTPTIPEGYKDKVVKVSILEIFDLKTYEYRDNAKRVIQNIVKAHRPAVPASDSKWIGKEKERLYDIPVTLVSIRGFVGAYGYSQIVKFITEEGNIIKWFTATTLPIEEGDKGKLTGTIKSLEEDKYEGGARVTIMTRCKIN